MREVGRRCRKWTRAPCDESFSTFLLDSINSVKWDPSDERHVSSGYTRISSTHDTVDNSGSRGGMIDSRGGRDRISSDERGSRRKEKRTLATRFLELLKTLGKECIPYILRNLIKPFHMPRPLAGKHAARRPRFILRDKNAIAWNFTVFIILV